ncbi:hypothetical protein [Deinococcus radiophilus]|uniref:RelA/SpoT domain-containing protein n=1 Tax=Deinococcus radiophilus TaxID=32062 RepID=A0A3S0I517_9DEIO|nr:hypothetical protein [Deinococcus radiophilus]RTR25305.1 hypothetical protein EJ104_11410 [Deinococcus radiophilus]UFA52045.1 hypothetical protein LMT64_14060 [Deinococcus radiophilus]
MLQRRKPSESEFVAQARDAQLSERCIHLSAALRERHPTDASAVEQPRSDLLQVYTQARGLAGSFAERLAAARWPAGAVAQVRPSGVKRLDRMVEKYLYSKRALVVPLDMLGAKVVVDSVWDMYDVASQVQSVFPVVGYRDRVVRPQSSGYRDLQFVVNAGTEAQPHYAELKVMHRLIDELDGYEHKLYEIRRELQAKETERQTEQQATSEELFGRALLSPIEQLVLDTLETASADLFDRAWQMILEAEHG